MVAPLFASINEVAMRNAYRGQESRGKAHTRSSERLVCNPHWTPHCSGRGTLSKVWSCVQARPHTQARSAHGGRASNAQSAPAATT